MKIRISTPSIGDIEAELTEENSTALAIWEATPFEGRANTWGYEIYFSIPLSLEPENPKDVVEMGDLGYWPPGNAFCIFFGPTPVSKGNEIRPSSPVNVFGKIIGDPRKFKKVKSGETIRIKRNG